MRVHPIELKISGYEQLAEPYMSHKGRGRSRHEIGPPLRPPSNCSGMTCHYQFQIADSEKQPFGPPSGVHTSRNHSFLSRQFESGIFPPNPYACRKIMHADSGNLPGRCSFSRSTTLPAAPSLPEVALTVILSENHRKSKIFSVVHLFQDFQII